MVKIQLQLSDILENIATIKSSHDTRFFLKLKCSNCGESDDVFHDISENEKVHQDTRNAKGYNLYIRCKMCSRENSMDVVEKSSSKLNY
jgi:ribosomal protein S27E